MHYVRGDFALRPWLAFVALYFVCGALVALLASGCGAGSTDAASVAASPLENGAAGASAVASEPEVNAVDATKAGCAYIAYCNDPRFPRHGVTCVSTCSTDAAERAECRSDALYVCGRSYTRICGYDGGILYCDTNERYPPR